MHVAGGHGQKPTLVLIFSYVTFKMATWRRSWIFRFPDSNFSLALNNSNATSLVSVRRSLLISAMSLSKWLLGSHIGYFSFWTPTSVWLWISSPYFSSTLLVCMERSLLIFRYITFKMAACWPYWIFWFSGLATLDFLFFRTLTSVWLWISNPNFCSTFPACIGK